MADYYVKLIVELENQVKAQLEIIESQMKQVQDAAREVNAAMKSIDTASIDKIKNSTSQADTSMTELRNSAKQTSSSIKSMNSSNIQQLSTNAANASHAMLTANSSSNALKTSLNTISNVPLLTTSSASNSLASSLNNTANSAREVSSALIVANESALQLHSSLTGIQSVGLSQVSNETRQLTPALQSASNGAKQLGDSFNVIDVNARTISSSTSKIGGLGDKLRSIIPTANQVKTSISNMGNSIRNSVSGMGGLNSGARLAGGGLSFLSSAASMTVGMIGYDLVNSIAMSARESINAEGNFQAFGERMGMTASEIDAFSQHCDNLQSSFRKVDMKAVGASALELGVKLKLPKESMEELTKTTAVMSSAFIKEGRTQTDAILAVSDAMDGQFRRMQELGISQEILMQNGWDGDIENKTSLLQAMNKTLDEMGFTETAMQVNTLDEAYQMLSVSGGQLLKAILIPITPTLIAIMSAIVGVVDGIKGFVGQLQEAWAGLPDWAQEGAKIGIFMGAIILLSSAIIIYLIPAITGGLMSALVSFGSMVGVTIIPGLATLSGAFMTVAAAAWAAVAPFLPFIAVAAAVAVAIYEVGKAFGWWTDVGSMLEAIKNNIGRLWDAFINHPDVKAVIQGIQDAWEGLNEFLKPVVDWLKGIWDEIFPESAKGKVDVTRMVIDGIGTAFATLKMILSPIPAAISGVISILSALWNVAKPIGEGIYNALKPIVCILLGCSPGIVPALQKVQEVFNTVFSAISGFIGGIVSSIVGAIQPLINVLSNVLGPAFQGLTDLLSGDLSGAMSSFRDAWQALFDAMGPVGDFLEGIFMPLFDAFAALFTGDLMGALNNFMLYWYNLLEAMGPVGEFIGEYLTPIFVTLVGIFLQVWNAVSQIIGVFQQFLAGQITLPQMLSQIWTIITQLFSSVFQMIIQGIIAFAQNIWNNAVNAGKNFLNGVIQFVQQLPGRFYSFLVSVISYIVSAGGQWISNAKNKAKGVVDGVLNFIKQLPGKVYTEFMNIGKRILSAGSDLVNKAKQVGQNIVDGILGAMGIHSPGTIQESVVNEFVNMLTRVKEKGNTAYDTAKQVGRRLIDGFKSENVNEELSEAINFTPQIESEESEGISFTQDNGDKGSDETGGAYGFIGEDMSVATESIMASNNAIGNSFSTLTNTISLNTGIIQTRTNGVVLSFNSTRAGVTNALSSMVSKNNSSWNNISRTTDDNLQSIQSSTLNVTGQMTSAWNSMKDSIISAAADIQSKANAHFNSLSSNIGGFYRRIQNPSSWAGPSTSGSRTSSRGAVSSGAGRLRNIVSSAITPTFAGTAPIYKLADSVCKNETCKEFYLTKNNRLERFDIEEFYRRANNNFAGWGDWSPKHFSYIKSRTGEWNMKGPVINLVGGIPTGLAFKVKQFENGSKPSLGMESFQKVAEAIFSVIGYDYYWNSDKTGDPITALQTGSVNCWDGAHSLMALANVFGLSASLGRGTGHVWAVINGKTFDTTNYSKHRSWSPLPGYTGPRRRNSTQKEEDNVPEVIDLNINQNVDVHLKSDGNIEVDEATIIDTLKGVITDRTLVDKIAKALKQRDRRINRMSGA